MLEKVSTSQAVVNLFTDKIKTGRLKPGESLPSEKALQDQLKVSRFALREGLARLSALGIIKVIHGKGAVITESIDPESLKQVFLPMHPGLRSERQRDLLEARVLLEGELAYLAANRRTRGHLKVFEGILDRSKAALDDRDKFGELDMSFHKAIAEAANNTYLLLMHSVIRDQLQPVLNRHARSKEQREIVQAKHEAVYQAIKKKSATRARTLSEENL
ncbi:MAG: FadR/GntR family transcriptional regulator [Verrucomicrobiota bacterium]